MVLQLPLNTPLAPRDPHYFPLCLSSLFCRADWLIYVRFTLDDGEAAGGGRSQQAEETPPPTHEESLSSGECHKCLPHKVRINLKVLVQKKKKPLRTNYHCCLRYSLGRLAEEEEGAEGLHDFLFLGA